MSTTSPSPFTTHSRAGDSQPGSRRPSAYQQSHARRGSAIPAHLLNDSNPLNSYGSPSSSSSSSPISAYGSPNSSMSGGGPGSRRASGAGVGGGHGHARRGSVIDIAADMLAGQAGVESLEKARKVTDKVEDTLEQWVKPVRPWLPGIGRFLIVVTFLEDALRILTQLGDQNYYLQKHRGFPWGISHMFLYTNVLIMLTCSSLIIAKRYPFYATIGLFSVVIAQGFGYGLIFDLTFFLRNLSVMGGLLMALSDALSGKKSNLVGVPTMGINDQDRKKYFQLFGRVLLVFLFLGFVFNGQTGWAKGMVSVSGLVACLFVALGYKAKQSALFLVVVLGTFNFTVNAWWRVHKAHPQRDFLKYDFFQTLSIVGGLLLLVNLGAGDFAIEQKKRM
ncbi:protein ERV29 [Sporobolomyces salmoneus]|uniref:protein ERV29 n=1 Tax=Sporobolomyces salmoneus TaxID=183962 RepID=UPI0031707B9D